MQFIQSVPFFTEKKRILWYHIQNVFHRSEWGSMHLLQACKYKDFVGSVKFNIKKGDKRKKKKINISRQYVQIKSLWCCCCFFLSEEIYNCICSISRSICTGNVQDVRDFFHVLFVQWNLQHSTWIRNVQKVWRCTAKIICVLFFNCRLFSF